ncbi:hypothetical protein D8682_20210 [Buttiauxella sp. 3AFRM03]|nr:hypothetical protein D8682_20210 [Buttiauxella sp. 3AFRM03]
MLFHGAFIVIFASDNQRAERYIHDVNSSVIKIAIVRIHYLCGFFAVFMSAFEILIDIYTLKSVLF